MSRAKFARLTVMWFSTLWSLCVNSPCSLLSDSLKIRSSCLANAGTRSSRSVLVNPDLSSACRCHSTNSSKVTLSSLSLSALRNSNLAWLSRTPASFAGPVGCSVRAVWSMLWHSSNSSGLIVLSPFLSYTSKSGCRTSDSLKNSTPPSSACTEPPGRVSHSANSLYSIRPLQFLSASCIRRSTSCRVRVWPSGSRLTITVTSSAFVM
mmetsp:Transcript_28901/g.65367  ORF Transcript_28901/g.65367 Transcript_28901/m.65367 type:complete len:208 (-) Transcript_28901:217-840(-)